MVARSSILLGLLVVLLPFGSAQPSYTVSDQDENILLAFYSNTDGPRWTPDPANFNWTDEDSSGFNTACLNPWNGLTCDRDDDSEGTDTFTGYARTTALNLPSSNLVGEICVDVDTQSTDPGDSLFNLEYLETLLLFDNTLSGCIPEFPVGSALTNLQLQDNFLESFPDSIGEATDLEILCIYNNDIEGTLPTELGNLANLEIFQAQDNDFTGGIPSELGNLQNLDTLEIQNNDLTGTVPTELGLLNRLEYLDISGNPGISGNLPSDLFGSSTGLDYLDLSGLPSVSGGPPNFPDSVETLILSDSGFTGTFPTLPTELVNFFASNTLYIDDAFGDAWANSPNTINIDISDSADLSGTFEESFYDLFLQSLDVSGTNICLEFPDTTGDLEPNTPTNWVNMTELYLQNSQAFADCSSRRTLVTTTALPTDINIMQALENWNVSNSQLTGTLPTQLGGLSALMTWDSSDNAMMGSIPSEVGQLTNLVTFDASNSGLSGVIPTEICLLTGVTSFDISGNDFVVPCPSCCGNGIFICDCQPTPSPSPSNAPSLQPVPTPTPTPSPPPATLIPSPSSSSLLEVSFVACMLSLLLALVV